MLNARAWMAAGWVLAGALAPGPWAQQQRPTPHLAYAFPAGGRLGASVEIKLGGQNLQGATAAYVAGGGVEVVLGEYHRPLTQNQFQQFQQKLREARDKMVGDGVRIGSLNNAAALLRIAREAGLSEAEVRDYVEFVRERNDPKRQPNPQIAETLALQVRVDPQAAPGIREIRVLTPRGLSNPVRFEVGDLPELVATPGAPGPKELGADLPVTVNGQILPGGADRFTLALSQGQRIVASTSARALVPFIADAVPGFFQATLSLRDAQGAEVAFSDHHGPDQDPVLVFEVPKDGTYTLEIRDAIYRGREDFVYRLSIGERPFVTGVYPLGGRAGAKTPVQAFGWNLPASKALVEGAAHGPGTIEFAWAGCGVPFALDTLPEAEQREPNDAAAQAQAVESPSIVNGRIDRPGDVDVYRVRGRAGETLVVEIEARRLGSPLDSTVQVLDARGKVLAWNDDHPDEAQGLETHHADSYVAVPFPADGTLAVAVRDAQGRGGAEYAYRVRLSAPRPDFELRVVPSSVTARPGTSVAMSVHVVRRDGFDGPVMLALDGAPRAFQLGGARVPQGVDRVAVTLTVPPRPFAEPLQLRLRGTAAIDGSEVSHEAVPAEDMMQAFGYRHLVPQQGLFVAVVGRAAQGLAIGVPEETLRVRLGGATTLRLAVGGPLLASGFDVALADGPDGLRVESATPDATGLTIVLRADAQKLKAGLRGNLVFDALLEPQGQAGNAGAPNRPAARRRVAFGQVPAIPFEIVDGP